MSLPRFYRFILFVFLPAIPIAAEEALIELDPYTVVSTATRTLRLAASAPVRTELLTPELFLSAGTRDLAAALDYLPGARVEANCQNCGTSEVKLLGLGAGYNQLLFDGQPLFSGLAAVYGLEHIPTAFIERIEVIKGGASSLYGPGAVAGVINIIPHEPLRTKSDFDFNYEVFAGEPSHSEVAVLDWVDATNRLAGTVYGEFRQNDAVDLNDDGFSDVTEKTFHTVGTHFWAYPTDAGRLSGNYAYTWEKRRGGDHFELPPHEAQITEQLEHAWHRGGLFWEQDLSPNFSFKLGGSVSIISRDSYYGGVGDVPLPGSDQHDPFEYAAALERSHLLYGYVETTRLYLDSIFTLHFDRHTLSWGAQWQRDSVFDEKRDEADRPLRSDGSLARHSGEDPVADENFEDLGFYLQDEWDPSENWTVIAGLRADQHSTLEAWVLSPRLALRFRVNQEWTLRASFATGFRAPEIFDEDFHIEILDNPTRTRNAPDLAEESSLSVTSGVVWTPAALAERLQLNVEFFRTEIDDTFNVSDLVFHDTLGKAYKLRTNAGGSSVQGLEANLLYRFTENLSLETGLNLTDARFDEALEVLPGIFERRYLESPRWSGVAQLNYTNEKLFDLFLGLIYTGPMIAAREAEGLLNRDTGHFFVVDLTLTKHFELGRSEGGPHLDITVGVRNLLDQRQDDLTTGPDRDTTYFYGPRFPRSYFVRTRIHF